MPTDPEKSFFLFCRRWGCVPFCVVFFMVLSGREGGGILDRFFAILRRFRCCHEAIFSNLANFRVMFIYAFFLEAFKYIWDSHNALRSSGFSKILLDCARLFEILGILDSRAGSLHVFEPFEFLEILRCGTHTNTVWKMLLHSLGFLIILKNNCNLRYKRITKLALETDSSRLSIDYRWIFSRSYDGTRIIPMMYKCRQ